MNGYSRTRKDKYIFSNFWSHTKTFQARPVPLQWRPVQRLRGWKKKTRKARAEGEADFKPVYVYNNKLLVMHVL